MVIQKEIKPQKRKKLRVLLRNYKENKKFLLLIGNISVKSSINRRSEMIKQRLPIAFTGLEFSHKMQLHFVMKNEEKEIRLNSIFS